MYNDWWMAIVGFAYGMIVGAIICTILIYSSFNNIVEDYYSKGLINKTVIINLCEKNTISPNLCRKLLLKEMKNENR